MSIMRSTRINMQMHTNPRSTHYRHYKGRSYSVPSVGCDEKKFTKIMAILDSERSDFFVSIIVGVVKMFQFC